MFPENTKEKLIKINISRKSRILSMPYMQQIN